MKKLMIATAIVCVAALSQAATVSWGGAAGNTGWTPSAEGQYAYLLYGSSAAELASTINIITAGDFGAKLVGQKADNGYEVVAWHKIDAAEDNDGYFTDGWGRDDSKGGVNGYYQIVLADAANAKFAVESADAVVSGITDTTPGGGRALFNDEWSQGSDYVGLNGFNGTFAAAPEPTSGLLLLLGVAGLALKRRRA